MEGQTQWLVQWNLRWGRYFLVGGHKEETESFRECVIREIQEELGLLDRTGIQVSPVPAGTLRYIGWSEGEQARTRYHLAAFNVELVDEKAFGNGDPSQDNQWLTEQEIIGGWTSDHKPVSDTMPRVLRHLGVLGPRVPVRPSPGTRRKKPHIAWQSQPSRSFDSAQVRARVEAELCWTLHNERFDELMILERLEGYTPKSDGRVTLEVELREDSVYRAYIVKLGSGSEFRRELAGWRQIVIGKGVKSRYLVPLKGGKLPHVPGRPTRFALVYQNANSAYGQGRESRPELLETAVIRSVQSGDPKTDSVERVIGQVYSDFNRWFYRDSREDAVEALLFYRRRIRRARDRWSEETWRMNLRRDALLLYSGLDGPVGKGPRHEEYVDPCEHLPRALDRGAVPPTLVGTSHGDLHGRNILVGFERREAENPSVFDYGEMNRKNVLAWDFVKLETELKVRLIPKLQRNDRAKAQVLKKLGWQPGLVRSHDAKVALERTAQLAFAYWFEGRLAGLAEQITDTDQAENRVDDPEALCPERPEVGRALAILLRVRKEAALYLGFQHSQQRGAKWLEEYYFALAVYGLCTAKWVNYERPHSLCALVSAGVAAARLVAAGAKSARGDPAPPAHGHRLGAKSRRATS